MEGTEMSAVAELLEYAVKELAGKLPRRVNIRDLSRHTSDVLNVLESEKTTAFITHRGIPRFMIVPIDSDKVSQLILAGTPRLFTEAIAEGERALREGRFAVPAEPDVDPEVDPDVDSELESERVRS